MSSSIKDVALHAGVSVGTVSNVLNHPSRVSSKTVKRVQKSINELGFVRNDAARQLRAGESRTIALLVFDAANPFFTALARGAEDAATDEGYSVILANTSESQEREHSYLDLFEEQRVRGILISPYGDVEERLSALKKFGIPSVLVDRVSENQVFSSVSVDDHAGGTIAANHLLNLGRTRIGFVGGPLEIPQVADRLRGAQDALQASPGATLTIFETSATTVLEGRTAGEKIREMSPAERPNALFAANDLVAIGLLQALVATGSLRVPDDIAIIGYDDIDFATSAIVPLTSIRQPSALMGETALKLLREEALDPSKKPRRVVFQPELVIRESA
ncbi:MAG: LacI family DNA-binding transcriptional regulator [Pontimonas sp.]